MRIRPRIALVLFDFFGVFCPDLFDCWAEEWGLKAEAAEIRRKYVRPADLGEITFRRQCELIGEELGVCGIEVEKGILSYAALDYSILNLYDELGATTAVALFSNAPQGLLESIFEQLGEDQIFRERFISSEIGLAKPSPAAFEHILNCKKIAAQEVVFIDDRPDNISAANKLGIIGVRFVSAKRLADDLAALGLLPRSAL